MVYRVVRGSRSWLDLAKEKESSTSNWTPRAQLWQMTGLMKKKQIFQLSGQMLSCQTRMGMHNSCTFIHDVKRLFHFMFLAIIFGIPGPRYLLPFLVQKILGLPVEKSKMVDVSHSDVLKKLQQIAELKMQ